MNTRDTAHAIRKLPLIKAKRYLEDFWPISRLYPSLVFVGVSKEPPFQWLRSLVRQWKNQPLYVISLPYRVDSVREGRTCQKGGNSPFVKKSDNFVVPESQLATSGRKKP